MHGSGRWGQPRAASTIYIACMQLGAAAATTVAGGPSNNMQCIGPGLESPRLERQKQLASSHPPPPSLSSTASRGMLPSHALTPSSPIHVCRQACGIGLPIACVPARRTEHPSPKTTGGAFAKHTPPQPHDTHTHTQRMPPRVCVCVAELTDSPPPTHTHTYPHPHAQPTQIGRIMSSPGPSPSPLHAPAEMAPLPQDQDPSPPPPAPTPAQAEAFAAAEAPGTTAETTTMMMMASMEQAPEQEKEREREAEVMAPAAAVESEKHQQEKEEEEEEEEEAPPAAAEVAPAVATMMAVDTHGTGPSPDAPAPASAPAPAPSGKVGPGLMTGHSVPTQSTTAGPFLLSFDSSITHNTIHTPTHTCACTQPAPCLCGQHTTVVVEARTWPGINKHGGIGRITKDNGGACVLLSSLVTKRNVVCLAQRFDGFDIGWPGLLLLVFGCLSCHAFSLHCMSKPPPPPQHAQTGRTT
jgi:hypothetical protein